VNEALLLSFLMYNVPIIYPPLLYVHSITLGTL